MGKGAAMRGMWLRTTCGVSLLAGLSSVAQEDARSARVLERGEWRDIPARGLADIPGYTPRSGAELSRYGGWKARRIGGATGFFRTVRAGGRWWLADPDGYLFLTVGLNSVSREGANRDLSVAERRFRTRDLWAKATATLLKASGFNSLGCWSDWPSFAVTEGRMPYFPRWNFMQTYKNNRPAELGPTGYPNNCMPLFDDAFEPFCLKHAEQLAATRDDPWLVGHFSDNELPFRPNLLDLYLELPDTDSGHRAAASWLAESRGRSNRPPEGPTSEEERDGFLEFAAARYYTTVAKAIKTHDPNHLYVGSRVHGRCIRPPVFRGARATDIVSVNYYHRWSPEQDRMREWMTSAARPFLISEWYAMRLDRPDRETGGAGFRVPTLRDRGLFYQNFVLGLLDSPGCVGWHWFKYGGDREGVDMGLVSPEFEPKTAVLDLMRELNQEVYSLAEHLVKRRDGAR